MLSPGATRSTHGPRLLNRLTPDPSGVVDPTATTPGYAAGYTCADEPALPAAATTSAPRLCAYVTASDSAGCDVPASERLTMRAPRSTAWRMPADTSLAEPIPHGSSTAIDSTRVCHPSEAMPVPL